MNTPVTQGAQACACTGPVYCGGPAFPQKQPLSSDHHGMSLRDYFMAHAPAEPQPWFHGVMPPPPAERMKRPDDITKAEAEELVGWGDWLNAADMTQPRARAIAEDWERHKREYSAWRAAQEKQRYIQWPAAWADAMLAQRAKGGAA